MAADIRAITTDVWYSIGEHPPEPIWSARGLGPEATRPRTKDGSLLRPKSAIGAKRNDADLSGLESPPPTSFPSPFGRPFSPLSPLPAQSQDMLQSLNEAFYSQHETPPVSPWEEEQAERARRRRMARFDAQRASLRHSRSIPQFNHSQGSDPPADRSVSDPATPPRRRLTSRKTSDSASRWQVGRLSLELWGLGGSEGARLRLLQSEECLLNRVIPGTKWQRPVDRDHWNAEDITEIHRSVFGLKHVISLPFDSLLPVPDNTQTPRTSEDSMVVVDPSDFAPPPPPVGIFSRRRRGKTITATASGAYEPDFARLVSSGPLPSLAPSQSSRSEGSSAACPPRRLFVTFSTGRDCEEWLYLLKLLTDHGTSPRVHRRLHLTVWDVQDNRQVLRNDCGAPSMGHASDILSDGKSATANSSMSQRQPVRQAPVLADWASKERVALSIRIDGVHVGRTTWQSASTAHNTPFWGEAFRFDNLPEATHCELRVYRMVRQRQTCFGTVSIPLISSFTLPKDERYAIMDTETGVAIGEVRMTVMYQEVTVQPREAYAVEPLMAEPLGTNVLSQLFLQGELTQCSELVVRLSLADGALVSRLKCMCDSELRYADPSTLFRAFTPFSKLLETAMRLVAWDLLQTALSPTIAYTEAEDGSYQLRDESADAVRDLASSCLTNLYSRRAMVPDCLRQIFSHVFAAVRTRFAEREMLHYKAIASFLFLRLIAPALMRPHLFGLADGLRPAPEQATLTLLAKILKTMAFFSRQTAETDIDLVPFTAFITDETPTMIDYIAGLSTLPDDHIPPVPATPISAVLEERRGVLPPRQAERIPSATPAGVVDAPADLALLFEILYERRRAPHMPRVHLATPDRGAKHVKDGLAILDRALDQVHEEAQPGASAPPSKSASPARPRRSLQLDLHARAPAETIATRIRSPRSWKWSLGLTSPKSDKRFAESAAPEVSMSSVSAILDVARYRASTPTRATSARSPRLSVGPVSLTTSFDSGSAGSGT